MTGAPLLSVAETLPSSAPWAGEAIDADVHVNVGPLEALIPYMDPNAVEWVQSLASQSLFQRPPSLDIAYPPALAYGADAGAAGDPNQTSDLQSLRENLLEPNRLSAAILNPYWGLESVRHPDLAALMARAINDWMVAEWLEKDDRLRGSVTVVHHDPAEAAREIERVGGHPGFVQVALPIWSQTTWGKRVWYPLFEAIASADLVAAFHFGGVTDGSPTAVGWPSYYVEDYGGATHVWFTQLVSIIGEGLFDAFPNLRMSFLESGFAWLPGLMWRITKDWKGLRRGIPWVDSSPSETMRERLRVSVQPLDGIPDAELARVIEWFGSDEMLIYASDYPHAHGRGFATALGALDEDLQRKIMFENARDHYRL